MGRLVGLYGRDRASRCHGQRQWQPPEIGTTLRIASGGTRHVHDGPFADTKEMLGGYVVVDLPDLDAALEWAARAPCVTAGSVEIRPVMSPPAAG